MEVRNMLKTLFHMDIYDKLLIKEKTIVTLPTMFLIIKRDVHMTRPPKLYFDHSFLLYYITYCYEFITIRKYI